MSDVALRNISADAAATDLETNAWYAIGNGDTGADQVSNERIQPAYDAAAAGSAALTATLSFTGGGGVAVTHLLVYDAVTAGSFRFSRPLSGDLAFNANGDLNLVAAPVVVS